MASKMSWGSVSPPSPHLSTLPLLIPHLTGSSSNDKSASIRNTKKNKLPNCIFNTKKKRVNFLWNKWLNIKYFKICKIYRFAYKNITFLQSKKRLKCWRAAQIAELLIQCARDSTVTTDLVMLNWDIFLFCFFERPRLTSATAKSERHSLLALTSVFVTCSYHVSQKCWPSYSSPCFCICACILAIISCIRLSWETQTQSHIDLHTQAVSLLAFSLCLLWETVPQPPSPAR